MREQEIGMGREAGTDKGLGSNSGQVSRGLSTGSGRLRTGGLTSRKSHRYGELLEMGC